MRYLIVMTFLGVVSSDIASAQSDITPSPSPVQQGQTLTIVGMPCNATKPTVMFDSIELPTTPGKDANSFNVVTQSLNPKTYKVTLHCGTAVSKEIAVQVDAATANAAPAASPHVICAENLTPKDDKSWLDFLLTDVLSSKGETSQTQPRTPEKKCDDNMPVTIRMEDALVLRVAGYSTWLNLGDNKTKPLHLFLEGIELENLTLHYTGEDPATKVGSLWTDVKFESDDTSDAKVTENRELWAQVLRIARRNNRLTVSVGPHGAGQWETAAVIRLNSYPKGLSWFAGVVIAGLIALLVWAGIKTPLLRDNNGAIKPPYSLAKHQMAAWFLVVVSAFLFVMMTTGAAAATSSTALILIGISGATGLAAIVMDNNKREATANDRQALEAERDALGHALDDAGTGLRSQLANAAAGSAEATQIAATIQAKVERLNVVTALLSKASPAPAESQGWPQDLLSDENGISFHRLQIAVWTVVLVGAFITAVWRMFAMPDFDTTTLGLMGISSGTYLGFKFPEKQS
jgi:hypothetical protein